MSEKKCCGKIKVILGPMFSGKTTYLIRDFRRWSITKKKPLCINYIMDDRYGNVCENNMYNHDQLSVKCIYSSKLNEIDPKIISEHDIILINEGQFFPDLVEHCKLWAETQGKNIIVSGLDGDFKREVFGEILKLIPLADIVEKLTAVCANCDEDAPFTFRKSKETAQVVIGSSNYIPLCRDCYIRETYNNEH
jgi:thymidine kinase